MTGKATKQPGSAYPLEKREERAETHTMTVLVDNEPGQGAELHLHPYSETWIVRSGRARITAGEEVMEAGPGDVVVVEPETPHGFRNLGPGRLELVCIHAAGRMVTRWLNDEVAEKP